ncbi:DUF3325 domain-containing protein [Pseudogemmobacter bohemicus]|uniref:DUF3325 domain-containing protein n=1 Tax=Pseudogemmobacter bohemicus TaxID=2250708 RepID=UPI001300850A|nr:DUF3325 domain-containing protein [Pseudogemmobacter bohemicus]
MQGWLSLILCGFGFAALSLAMPRHHEEVLGGKPPRRRRILYRAAAIALLALSFALALQVWPNLTIAISAWLGLATVAAFAVAMLIRQIAERREPQRGKKPARPARPPAAVETAAKGDKAA